MTRKNFSDRPSFSETLRRAYGKAPETDVVNMINRIAHREGVTPAVIATRIVADMPLKEIAERAHTPLPWEESDDDS